jgi:hypothetical protein
MTVITHVEFQFKKIKSIRCRIFRNVDSLAERRFLETRVHRIRTRTFRRFWNLFNFFFFCYYMSNVFKAAHTHTHTHTLSVCVSFSPFLVILTNNPMQKTQTKTKRNLYDTMLCSTDVVCRIYMYVWRIFRNRNNSTQIFVWVLS